MIANLTIGTEEFSVDFSMPLDISLPLRQGNANPTCYYADPVKFETIEAGDFIGSVAKGGSVNYQKITLTPHGNGTHTECYGHISSDQHATINSLLKEFHFVAELISIEPERKENNDEVITLEKVKNAIKFSNTKALIIRSLPNSDNKKHKDYSGTNPPYLEAALTSYLVEKGIEHLLIDLPSVDKEMDGGALSAHKNFWKLTGNTRKHCTITELIFAPSYIEDGLYLLNLQISPIEIDAAPSKPILYKLREYLP